MSLRSQLEMSVADALRTLSPEDTQRVAEDYARVRFPDRFPGFNFRAFSEEGKSRKGWPDAWIDTGGRIYGVEATGARDKAAIKEHLADDLHNAKTRHPKLSGLIIVSSHPNVQFSCNEVVELRQKFIDEAGLDPDCIHFVSGSGLVEELSRPEFARTRFEVLGLPVSPNHFKLVHSKRGPDERRLSDFVPSDEDYALGHVYRPEIADRVLAKLEQHRVALVRGVGACGKSVLAWLLALEAAEQRKPSYILDLADYIDANPDTGSALVEDLHRFGHPHALFILDNCHLAENLAKEVVLASRELANAQRPRVLLLGRELGTSRGSLIDGLNIEPLVLKARQPEVRGVYFRLAWRCTGNRAPPEPPPAVLDHWVSTFGGEPQAPETTTDLIAFSAAARRRMTDLLHQRWILSEIDAIHEVRSVYLEKLSDAETQNLMRLCAMEELEMSLGERALVNLRTGFQQCSKHHGLVFRQTARSERFIRYRLAHAALGRLILRAAYETVDPVATRIAIARQDPHAGSAMVGRLIAIGRSPEARGLVLTMMETPTFLGDIGSLQYVHQTLSRIQRLGLSLPTNLGQGEVERERLVEQALQTPLGDLANFLSYAARTEALAPMFAALARELVSAKNLETLVQQALQTPPHFLVNFLSCAARTDALAPVFEALARELISANHLKTLVEHMLQAPLHFLANFLSYAARTEALAPVFAALARELASANNFETLVEQALQAPLGDLENFLSYAATTDVLAPVSAALARELASANNFETLVEQALQTPLHSLVNFLSYAAKTAALAPVFAALARELASAKNLETLVEQALQAPLGSLANFLSCSVRIGALSPLFNAITNELAKPQRLRRLAYSMEQQPLDAVVSTLRIDAASGLWAAAFAKIDAEAWEKARRLEATPNIDAFVAFQRIATQKGRPELSAPIALRLMHESTHEVWHQESIRLHHLSNVLQRASAATTDDIQKFLDRVATPKWINQQMEDASAGGLAGAVFSFAVTLEPDRRGWFSRDGLSRRVLRELSNMKRNDAEICAEALALLGAASVIGVSVSTTEIDWPDASTLSEVIRLRQPAPDRVTIGYLQSQLWHGLREMSRLRLDAVAIPPVASEQILALWQATETDESQGTLPPHLRTLNTVMISWLQKCKASGWRLVAP